MPPHPFDSFIILQAIQENPIKGQEHEHKITRNIHSSNIRNIHCTILEAKNQKQLNQRVNHFPAAIKQL